jgi:large subunit ribosomal protein L18
VVENRVIGTMDRHKEQARQRKRRKRRVRKRVFGTAERPRLSVFRSLQHIYAQIINDEADATICSASTRGKDLRTTVKKGGNAEAARLVGQALAEKAVAAGVSSVCFDRSGYKFHGRIKALADAAREGGLKF